MLNKKTVEQAEAKLIESFTVLVWLIPLLYGLELAIAAYTGREVLFSGDALASVLKTLIWAVVFLQIAKMIFKHINRGSENPGSGTETNEGYRTNQDSRTTHPV